jgi:flagellar protein FlaJ
MKRKTIPFVPFPISNAEKITKPLYGIGKKLSKIFPILDVQLERAELELGATEYLSIALFSGVFWMVLLFGLFIIIPLFRPVQPNFIIIMFIAPAIIGMVNFFYLIFYPTLLITKKVRDLEKNLLFALRHLQIQIKSGVPLFDGLVSVSNANYGLISDEFKKAIKRISTGSPEVETLEEIAIKNPSLHFRRIIWQITNAIKSGSDLGETLDSMVVNFSDEQKIAIRKYGSQLNPLAMMYMMTAVILPNLGITFLLIISSFTGFVVSKMIFWLILVAMGIFQFSFIGIIKNRRPAVEI